MDIKAKLKEVKSYWKTPPKGRYIPYNEIVSLAVGGFGVRFIVWCLNQMILTVGNTLIGNTIGIPPRQIYIIYILSILSGFPLTALRAKMIDNTRSMKGKYRPYILSMGIPTTVLGILFILMPYEKMNVLAKCITVLVFNIGFQFFYNFFFDAYQSIINVLSPNTIERSDVQSIRSVVENLSPSVAGIFMPLAARLITGENTLYNLKVFRVLFPPMLLVGLAFSILIYVNNEEKIVQARTHIVQIKFTDALRSVIRNKYFWVISLAGWLGFLETSFGSVLGWLYNYQGACSAGTYSLIVAITGNASLWSMLLAPFLIRFMGKRSVMLFSNLLNVGFIALMLPVIKLTGKPGMIWILVLVTFINQVLTSLGNILTVSINADIRDYQQYITGKRIDGMFAAVGLIGSVITLLTSSVLPEIYDRVGLNEETAIALGFDPSNVYNVLYNTEYFVHICSVLIIASVVGATLNALPFFFYDLTETRQNAMIRVLKVRAALEDYGNGALTDDSREEAESIINSALKYENASPDTVTKKQVYASYESKKEARKAYKEIKAVNEEIAVAKIVADELHRFDDSSSQLELETAKKLLDAGLNGFTEVELPTKEQIKALPCETQAQKNARRSLLMTLGKMKTAKKTQLKFYPDGVPEAEPCDTEAIFNSLDLIDEKERALILQLKEARQSKDTETENMKKQELSALKQEKATAKKQLKKATDENAVYYRATQPYADAQRLVLQAENYGRLNEIFNLAVQ